MPVRRENSACDISRRSSQCCSKHLPRDTLIILSSFFEERRAQTHEDYNSIPLILKENKPRTYYQGVLMRKKKELSEVRIERGYSLEEASDRIGIGTLALREYETHPNIIPINLAKEIFKFYRISGDEINFSE